ncbi:hypothetical protein EIP86_010006 [Pleurotus ostreatoroseus]|nr:hypothetical protein EIP86_010006 [Pleurotus ostreatoroseus]
MSPLAKAYLIATDRMKDTEKWRLREIVEYHSLGLTSRDQPLDMASFSDLNYIIESGLLHDFFDWSDKEKATRYRDKAWMSTFEHMLHVRSERKAAEHAVGRSDQPSTSRTVDKGKQRAGDPPTSTPRTPQKTNAAGSSGVVDSPTSTPRTPQKSNAAGSSAAAAQETETPRSAALIKTFDAVSLLEKAMLERVKTAAVAYCNAVDNSETEPPLPFYDETAVPGRTALTVPSGELIFRLDMGADVLRSKEYELTKKAKVKLVMLAITPKFGQWLYNIALIRMDNLYVDPPISKNARKVQDNMQLHRFVENATQSHHLVGAVVFGTAPVESQLLVARPIPGFENRVSKSITIIPLGVQFTQIYSKSCDLFRIPDLHVGVFKKGVSIRTRITPLNGGPGRAPSMWLFVVSL